MFQARQRILRYSYKFSPSSKGATWKASDGQGYRQQDCLIHPPEQHTTRKCSSYRFCVSDSRIDVLKQLEIQQKGDTLSQSQLRVIGESDWSGLQVGRDVAIGHTIRYSSMQCVLRQSGISCFDYSFATGPLQPHARHVHGSGFVENEKDELAHKEDSQLPKKLDSEPEPRRSMPSGWTSKEINWPNAISLARLASGPYLAMLIFQNQYAGAFVGLAVAAASDWLDGFVARRQGIDSVLGSYLDPLADKVLVGCVGLAMALKGLLPTYLVILMVTRDLGLVAGAFIARAYQLGWKWRGWTDFFQVSPGGAVKMEPLFMSKVNTVAQLALVAAALGHPAIGLEDSLALVPSLSAVVATTTILSGAQYAYLHASRKNASMLVRINTGTQKGHSQPK